MGSRTNNEKEEHGHKQTNTRVVDQGSRQKGKESHSDPLGGGAYPLPPKSTLKKYIWKRDCVTLLLML